MRTIRRAIAGGGRFATAGAPAGALPATGSARSLRAALLLVVAALCAAAAWSLIPAGAPSHATAGLARAQPVQQGWAGLPATTGFGLPRASGGSGRAYWAGRTATGAIALHNSTQRLDATLTGGRVSVSAGHGTQLGLTGLALGRGSSLTAVKLRTAASINRNRVLYSGGAISEWFANGPQGLEQGFTLAHRPAGHGPVVISQRLAGNLHASVSAQGESVTFSSRAGSLSYEDLVVRDARGRLVPARLGVSGGRLTITIDDSGAAYPLRVDPLVFPVSTQSAPEYPAIAIGQSNTDTLTVTGTSAGGAPTGSVSFYICDAGANPCNGDQVGGTVYTSTVSGDSASWTSAPITPSALGGYCFLAVYSGDSNYYVDGSADECFGVNPAMPTVSSNPTSGSIAVGGSDSDHVTVSGNTTGGTPTGWVTFYWCGPSATSCDSTSGTEFDFEALSGGAVTSVSFTPPDGPGSYCFDAEYSGGGNYLPGNDGSSDECFTVTKATAQTVSAPELSVIPIGGSDEDTVTVTGNATGGSPGGTVTFYECGPDASSCASTANEVGTSVALSAGAGDTSSATSAAFAPPSGPGTYCFDAVYSGDSNYLPGSDQSADECFSVDPTLDVYVAGHQTYGGTGGGFAVVGYSGFVNGDGPSVVTGTLAGCQSSVGSGAGAGTYYLAISDCSGLSASGYAISYVDDGFTVDPAPLQITAVPASDSMTYGGSAPAVMASYSGLVNGDAAPSTQPTCTTAATSSSPVGSYPASCSGASDPNYTISYVNGSVSVTAATLQVTATGPLSTPYGTVPAITPSYSGFVGSDGPGSLSTQATCTTDMPSTPAGTVVGTTCSGASDPNYTMVYVSGSFTVTETPLQITASSAAISYGQSAPAVTASYSGFVGGENASDLTGTLSCTTAGSPPYAAGDYGTSCMGLTSTNYSITYVGGTLSVAPAPLLVYVAGSQTYGSATQAFQIVGVSGLVGGDTAASVVTDAAALTCTSSVPQSASVATYYLTISGCSGPTFSSNYAVSYVDDGLAVTPAALKITASGGSMTYGGTVPTITAGYSGFVNGDGPSSLTPKPTCSPGVTSASPVGSYVTSCYGASDPNYTISYASGSVTVGQAALTITASSPTITYGGGAAAVSPIYSGFVNNDNASDLSTQPSCSVDQTGPYHVVGAYTTSCTGAAAANYSITYGSGTLTVTPAPLVITASSGAMTYGGATPTIAPQYAGFENGDHASALTSAPTCSPGASSSSPAGLYASSCSGAADPDYAISYVSGTVTVNPAPLTITAPNVTMTYGGSVPAITAGPTDYNGFVNGDSAASLTTKPTCFTTASSSSPITSTPPTICKGASDPNYTISYVKGTVTINPASLTVTASSPTITYGASTPAITPLYSGFVNGESASSLPIQPTCSTTAGPTTTVGSTPATSCNGPISPRPDGNYVLTYLGGAVTVDPAPLQALVSGTQVYGGTSRTYSVTSYSGFVNGQTNSAVSGSPSCSTSVGANAPVGSYFLTISGCSGLSSPNYAISYDYGTFTVTPATLTITATPASSTMTYGGPAPAITPFYSGWAGPDTGPSALTQPAVCSTTAGPTSDAGSTLPATCAGASDPNYTFVYVAGSVTVNPAPLQITASSSTILYGGSVPAVTPTYSGFVNNDDIGDLTAPASCQADASSTSPVSGSPYATSCSGAVDSNYAITYVDGTVTVDPAPLAITVTGTQVYGGAGLGFTIAGYSGFVNSEGPGVLTGSLSGCTTSVTGTTPAGVYDGTISGCGGLSDSNYAITYPDGGFTVTDAHTASVSALPLASIAVGQGESDSVVVTGNVVGGAPTGSVAFYVCAVQTIGKTPCATGGTQVGADVTLTAVGGTYTSTATSVAFAPSTGPGTYCMRAQYLGDNNYTTSSDGTLDECFTVTQAGATITASPSSTSVALGDAVTDSATLGGNAAGGPPTGSVTFYACTPGSTPCSSGGSEIGTADLVSGTGNSSTATSSAFLATNGPGVYCLRSVYSGDANYAGSTDGTADQCFTVTKGASATASAPSAATILSGAVSDTATVTGNAAGGPPTGTVSFYVCGPGASSCASTSSALGSPVSLTAGGSDSSTAASPDFTPSTPGNYCFYALYSGDARYAASSDATSDGCFSLAAAPAAPSTPSAASTVAPSNAFTILGHAHAHDTITVTLDLPGAGTLELLASTPAGTSTLAADTVSVAGSGRMTASLTLNKHAAAALAKAIKHHKAYSATVTITFTPTGGSAATQTLTVTLAAAPKHNKKTG